MKLFPSLTEDIVNAHQQKKKKKIFIQYIQVKIKINFQYVFDVFSLDLLIVNIRRILKRANIIE